MNTCLTESPTTRVTDQFLRSYKAYERIRDRLHSAEQAHQDHVASPLLLQALNCKEKLAVYSEKLLRISPSFDAFENSMRRMLTHDGKGIDTLPLSLANDKLSSPAASILATISNLKITNKFVASARKSAGSILLSGSTAWGPFYAVNARLSLDGPEVILHDQSDIDLLIVVSNIAAIGKVLQDFFMDGYVQENELERFAAFLKLQKTTPADMFSMRTYYDNVEVSIHFLSYATVEKICATQVVRPELKSGEFDFLIDFRPNTAASIVKRGGYPLCDVKTLMYELFVPTSQAVHRDEDNKLVGYLSQSPTGGRMSVTGQETYIICIIPFYLIVLPKILLDNDNRLAIEIKKLQHNIRSITNGVSIAYVNIADRRMTKKGLATVKRSLTTRR